jgi:hypothetical protein
MVVHEFVKSEIIILQKLSLVGIKDVNTAMDYLSIYETYMKYITIKSQMERIEATSIKCKAHTNTVRTAIKKMQEFV